MPRENTERKPKRWRQHPALPALLAALLAFVMVLANHSWSKFYTDSWDGYSELLAVGRITQLQQGQSAPGGFLGVYTAEWGDGEGYALLKDNTPQSPEDYKSYVHQSGLQGTLEGGLARALCRVPALSGEGRLNVLYFVNCWLFYLLAVRLCLALAGHYGPGAGLGALAAVWFAPWLTMGAKNLYWVLWTWLLPCCAGLALANRMRKTGRLSNWALAGVFAAVLVRCLCGFEYITTILILCEIPLAVCWLEQLGPGRRRWFTAMLNTGMAGIFAVLTALAVWLGQCTVYYGSFARALQEVGGIALARAGGAAVEGDTASALTAQLGAGQVLQKYALAPEPQLQLGPVGAAVMPVLALGAVLAGAALVWALVQRKFRQPRGLCGLWVLGLAAPLSWMLLSKGHSYVHPHLTPMLWSFALLPCTAALLGWWCQILVQKFLFRKEIHS